MNGRTASAALALALPLLAAAPSPGPIASAPIAGQCSYSDRLAEYAAETTFVFCDTLVYRDAGKTVTIDFIRRTSGRPTRFSGTIEGGKLIVRQLALNGAAPLPARGTCTVSYRLDGTLAAAACLAQIRGRWIAANFVPSRIDPPEG